MTVSPMAAGEVLCGVRPGMGLPLADLRQLPSVLRQNRAGHGAGLAVGETVILLIPPSPSILKHLLKGEDGAAE